MLSEMSIFHENLIKKKFERFIKINIISSFLK